MQVSQKHSQSDKVIMSIPQLMVFEKPAAAEEMARILDFESDKAEGYWKHQDGRVITSLAGHLVGLKEPEEYDKKWEYWSLETLPILIDKPELKQIASNDWGVKQLKMVIRLLKQAKEIVNCCDAGQEGELIFAWTMQYGQITKPYKRLWSHSLTDDELKRAYKNLKTDKEVHGLLMAGYARAYADWLLGMNGTRAFTKKFIHPEVKKKVLTIGRCQTPSLALLVDRFHKHNEFVPSDFWTLETEFKGVVFKAGRFDSIEKANQALNTVTTQELVVVSVEEKQETEKPPKLFDTNSIQRSAFKVLGIAAEDTGNVLQGLYEKKMITYPRVDNCYLTEDMVGEARKVFKKLSSPLKIDESAIDAESFKSKRIFNTAKVTDHHAIIPTGKLPENLSAEEVSLYSLIVVRFIQAFGYACKFNRTVYLAKVGDIQFKATGKQIIDLGWKKGEINQASEDEEDVNVLLKLTKDQKGQHSPRLTQGKTTPPALFDDDSFLAALASGGQHLDDKEELPEEVVESLKKTGIGRPPTQPIILKNLLERGFVIRKDKKLVPTYLGIALIGVIKNKTLTSPILTGEWEGKLRDIEAGKYSYDEFIQSQKEYVKELVEEVKQQSDGYILVPGEAAGQVGDKKKKKDTTEIGTCPECKNGKIILLKVKNEFYGCSNYKMDKTGCGFTLPILFNKKALSNSHIKALVEGKKTKRLKFFSESKQKEYEARLFITKENGRWEIKMAYDNGK